MNLIFFLIIFAFGFGPIHAMTVRGAAYATVIARIVASVIALIILLKGSKGIKLHLKDMVPEKKAIKLLLKIGLPSSIGQGISALGFTVLQGAGDTKPIMILNIIRLWGLRVPIVFLLVTFTAFGPVSIWIGLFASNLVVAIVGLIILSRGKWMYKLDPDEI